MAAQISLNELIEALAGAVIGAQDRIEKHQVDNLRNYFDQKTLRPHVLNVRLPSMHPQAEEGAEEMYRAPVLGLVPATLLKIKDVEISFDVDLVEMTEPGAEPTTAPGAGGPPPAQPAPGTAARTQGPTKNVRADLRAGFLRRRAGAVHVVLRVEAGEPTEGVARLVNHLVQTQGVVTPPMKPE
jgi:hypothetical protein